MLAAVSSTVWVLAAVAGVTALLWLASVGAYALAIRPRDVDPGPRTPELGDESPAVVALLTADWDLPGRAVPATLVDLAARGFLDIEMYGGDHFICRLHSRTPAGEALTPYEDRVLEHVRSKAVDGVVPAEALTTGREEFARGWFGDFRGEVLADARGRGLSRPRLGGAVTGAFLAASFVPAVLTGLAFAVGERDPSALAAGIGVLVGAGAVLARLRGERDTPAGREAAARWLGVADYLDDSESFTTLPPAAVAVWDRNFSYGAALGITTRALAELPMGADEDRRAVVHSGGRWRTVKIRYPRVLWPPGWGIHPFLAFFFGGLVAGLATWGLTMVLPPVWDFLGDKGGGVRTGLVAGTALALAWIATAATFAVRGLLDLFTKKVREGVVLRVRRYGGEDEVRRYVAVDDGHSHAIRAWRVSAGVYDAAREGSRARVVFRPRLGHVVELTPSGETPPTGA